MLSVYNRSPEQFTKVFIANVAVIWVSGVVVTHIQRVVFIKLGWLDLRLPKLLPRLILSSVLTSVGISIIDIFTDRYSGLVDTQKPFVITDVIVNVFAVLLLVLAWNAIYFTFHFFQRSRVQEISNLELMASNRESELKNLRSQLNPHFLFNSLNSIRALVDLDPKKAKVSVTTLSNLLRSSLELGKENLVPLEKELDLAKSYLELEKIRFEERLKVDWQLTPGLEQFEIPPFTLQMLIENAIKHGISNLIDGGLVEVLAFEEDGFVVLEVRNSGSLEVISDLGVGIENIKKRLNLQYGDGATFDLSERNEKVVAQIKFRK
jgi:sensor histidine kinase YesM